MPRVRTARAESRDRQADSPHEHGVKRRKPEDVFLGDVPDPRYSRDRVCGRVEQEGGRRSNRQDQSNPQNRSCLGSTVLPLSKHDSVQPVHDCQAPNVGDGELDLEVEETSQRSVPEKHEEGDGRKDDRS